MNYTLTAGFDNTVKLQRDKAKATTGLQVTQGDRKWTCHNATLHNSLATIEADQSRCLITVHEGHVILNGADILT